jgi:predicted transcriptional regulator
MAPDVRDALDRFAAQQNCSRSWLADRALRDWLQAMAAVSTAAPTLHPTKSATQAP